MTMPYPRSGDKVKDLIIETLEIEKVVGNLLLKVDENKKQIQKFFDENDIKSMEVPIGEESSSIKLVCKKSERATIKYDVEQLKKKLDSDLFLEVTTRTYTIKDINKMINLVKSAGVKSRDFKELIDVKVTANNQEIKRLYDVGEITMKQLKGAYTATISKSIKITEETGDKN